MLKGDVINLDFGIFRFQPVHIKQAAVQVGDMTDDLF